MTSAIKSQINKILDKIPSLNILVVGDCMLDHYLWGDVYRISPEAPVPVVKIERDTYRLGGACNVALNLKSLGAQVELMGPMGKDAAGLQMQQLLKDAAITVGAVNFREDLMSVVKSRVIARNQQLCRLDRDTILEESVTAYFEEILEQKVKDVDAVLISDYAKGAVTQRLLNHLIKLKQQYSFFLAMDPKPTRALNYSGLDLLKPNRSEALLLSGLTSGSPFSVQKISELIRQKYAIQTLAITLGEEGLALSSSEKVCQIYPTLSREVFDVSGAGDTALAALTLAFCSDVSEEAVAFFANCASSVVVGKLGTATVTPEEILNDVA